MSYRKLSACLAGCAFAAAAFFSCSKKDNSTPITVTPTADFKNKKKLVYADSSFLLTLPTAFTPNGDGVNDTYFPIGMHISNAHYSLTITTVAGATVYQTNDYTAAWNGRNTSGIVQTDYKYNVAISFTTARGRAVDTSTYVYLIPTTNTCAKLVWADTAYYAFPDQIDISTGFRAYATNEVVCP